MEFSVYIISGRRCATCIGMTDLVSFPVLLLHKMDLLAFTYQFELTNPIQHPYILQDSYGGRDQMTSASLELFK